ncbi:sterol desaturase family protein [Roseomonas sp. OT10]|uniref:sterol desaturase family protein n=1 Tax=Roseomonas cutis TaxID=2897332 RepID=UPI001E633965|nr:sterol desaturase family protein [Roseomonas sp. OT10]UFN48006.1 sterol desaturase family protein [Roseomonas sp. OT10]
MFDALRDLLDGVTNWAFTAALQPLLYELGLMAWEEEALNWLGFVVFGLLQVAVVYAICRPLEAWRPVEPRAESGKIRTDIVYTLLARLGLLPLLAFVLLSGVGIWLNAALADLGWVPPSLESALPWLRDHQFVAFLLYVAILDLGEYWRHRLQHSLPWWWALHSIHHAQTQMTFWTDDRNHVIDDLIGALWLGGLALAIGVPPEQFPLIVLLLRLAEALSHANLRLSFGRIGERLVVSPRFHRLHHGVLSAGQTGRNYAVLLPVWDWIFGTADWKRDAFPETGDPEAPEALVSGGWWRQQVVGARRMWAALRGREAEATPRGAAAGRRA